MPLDGETTYFIHNGPGLYLSLVGSVRAGSGLAPRNLQAAETASLSGHLNAWQADMLALLVMTSTLGSHPIRAIII